jgi:RHS Repeat.
MGRLSEQWAPFEIVNGNVAYTYTKTEYYKNSWRKSEKTGKDKVALYQPAVNAAATEYTYYGNGKVKTITDNENRKTEYAYDNDGNIAREDIYTDAVNKLTTGYTYNAIGKVQEKKQHARAGDIFDNPFSDNSVAILTTTYIYDPDGNLKTMETPDHVVTTYDYDNLGHQEKTSTPGKDETGMDADIETSAEYDFEGKILTSTDAKGNETDYAYNKRGLLTKITDALGGVTAFGYDRAGRKTLEVSPKNYEPAKALNEMSRVEYIYDVMGRVKAKKDIYRDPVTGQWTTLFSKTYKYDNSGNVIKELDARGYEEGSGSTLDERISSGYGTEYTYTMAGQAVTVTDAETKRRALPYTVMYGYDAMGRKISETDANGAITLYEYDNGNHILSVKVKKNQAAAVQAIGSNTYDLAGRQTSHKDGNNNVVNYQYTAFGKLGSATYPGDESIDANVVTYQYDVVGNLKKQIDSMGKKDLYSYDNQGRMTSHHRRDQARARA